jgi:ArsR family transcriptional regulator, arsenate/arsenite/antimonite-responsive transcriptional repressor
LGLANATLSFHLKELAVAGLLVTRADGRYIIYSADFEIIDLCQISVQLVADRP